MITLIKLLTWLASPIGLLTSLSLVAFGLRLLNKAPRTRLLLIIIAIGQLLLFAWPPVAVYLSQGLEAEAKALEAQNQGNPYAAILLLGGGISPAVPGLKTANTHEAFDRVIHAASLYHDGLAPRIIASGGNSLRDNNLQAESEAAAMQAALILMGIPKQAILLEEQSLTTRQNMAFTADLLKTRGITGRLALVTSATHMSRAAATAQRAGMAFDVYPTDWIEPLFLRPFAQRLLPSAPSRNGSRLS